jgi:hypothetical protein
MRGCHVPNLGFTRRTPPSVTPSRNFSLIRILTILAILIYLADMLAMVILYFVPFPNYLVTSFLDGIIMMVIILPGLYFCNWNPSRIRWKNVLGRNRHWEPTKSCWKGSFSVLIHWSLTWIGILQWTRPIFAPEVGLVHNLRDHIVRWLGFEPRNYGLWVRNPLPQPLTFKPVFLTQPDEGWFPQTWLGEIGCLINKL